MLSFESYVEWLSGHDDYLIINHRNPDVKAAYDVLNDRERYQRLLQEGNPEYERLVKRHQ